VVFHNAGTERYAERARESVMKYGNQLLKVVKKKLRNNPAHTQSKAKHAKRRVSLKKKKPSWPYFEARPKIIVKKMHRRKKASRVAYYQQYVKPGKHSHALSQNEGVLVRTVVKRK